LPAAHGLQGFLAAQGLHGFFAAQGLQAFFAAHGFLAAQGFLAAHGLHGFFAAQGLQAAYGTCGATTAPTTTTPAPTMMAIAVVDNSLLVIDGIVEASPSSHVVFDGLDIRSSVGVHRVTSCHAFVIELQQPDHAITYCGERRMRVMLRRFDRVSEAANTYRIRWRALVLPLLLMLGISAHEVAANEQPVVPTVVEIPAGEFIAGSDAAEREAAYRLDEEAYGHSVTRKQRWYDSERQRSEVRLDRFWITRTPVSNRQYAAFLTATGRPAPDVDAATWRGYRLIHPFERTRRHAWIGGSPPVGRADHPVVLVSNDDAVAYAAWLSTVTGATWRLPAELEWEKAARGAEGRRFPWGDGFDPTRLNSHDAGPFDTLPVGRFTAGASPFGVLDAAGQVFEWTAEPAGPGRFLVKGGSWDDKGCGVCRPAARHSRPRDLKHILIGFRLVRE
jgi:formylglycine-generating enzyme required for sulfatase activity